jgi:hypothetical protein
MNRISMLLLSVALACAPAIHGQGKAAAEKEARVLKLRCLRRVRLAFEK